jgi:radical SAM-linked protein
MYKIRICFSKTGYSKYVSHLDLMKTLQRTFRRGGIDISYSQGFNPHPIMSIAHPLPLGVEGLNEYMDISVDSKPDFEELKIKMNNALPQDIRVHSVFSVDKPLNILVRAEYTADIVVKNSISELEQKITEFLSLKEIVVEKKTKRGVNDTDIKPMIFDVSVEKNEDKDIRLKFVLANGEPANLKAVTFFAALEKYIEGFEIDYFSLVRNNLYDANMQKIVVDK